MEENILHLYAGKIKQNINFFSDHLKKLLQDNWLNHNNKKVQSQNDNFIWLKELSLT